MALLTRTKRSKLRLAEAYTLRCGRISIFQIAIKLIKKFYSTHHHSHQHTSQRLVVVFIIIFNSTICGSVSFHEIAFFNARSGHGESRQVKIINCCYNCFRHLGLGIYLSLPSQHHSTVYRKLPQDMKTSNCCPRRMQTHSKSSLRFQPAKYLEYFVQKVLY